MITAKQLADAMRFYELRGAKEHHTLDSKVAKLVEPWMRAMRAPLAPEECESEVLGLLAHPDLKTYDKIN